MQNSLPITPGPKGEEHRERGDHLEPGSASSNPSFPVSYLCDVGKLSHGSETQVFLSIKAMWNSWALERARTTENGIPLSVQCLTNYQPFPCIPLFWQSTLMWKEESHKPQLIPSPATERLCTLGQVTSPLRASTASSMKGIMMLRVIGIIKHNTSIVNLLVPGESCSGWWAHQLYSQTGSALICWVALGKLLNIFEP